MRVALISRAVAHLHGFGGLERHAYELAAFLARARVDVTLFTMPPIARGAKWDLPVQVETVATSRLPLNGIADRITNYPIWSARVGELVAAGNFDLAHAQGLGGWGVARQKASGRTRIPLLINPQGMEEFKTSPLKRAAYTPMHLMLRQAARLAEGLIAADSQAYQDIPRFLRVPPEKVFWIPNGIDVQGCLVAVSPAARQRVLGQFALASRLPLLLSVGRIQDNKGFDLLIEALARLRPRLPSRWVWVLVGDGPLRPRLEEQIRQAKLGDHARLLGRVSDAALHNLYDAATLFIHPTLFEGSSLVTLEAMAHSKPIVASAVGGIPDKVHRGQNGFLVTPGSVEELFEKIGEAMQDPVRLKQMGEESFRIVSSRFDWSYALGQTLALYQRFVPAARQP